MKRRLPILLAVVVALAPECALAETVAKGPAAPAPVVDVELRQDGVLIGQVVADDGAPRVGAEVRLELADGRSASAKTNKQGGFAFSGLSGVAQVQTEHAGITVRAWQPGTAPPKAARALLVVDSDQVARGQYYAGAGTQSFVNGSKRLFANPLFVAGVIGTAVAVPIAIANDDDDPAS